MWVWVSVVAVALAVAGVALAVWVRLAPVDPGRWHVDPSAAAPPGPTGWLVAEGGDARPPRLGRSAAALLADLDRIARATPRTRVIAGSVEDGRITYETRSRLWGFPDYTTVTAVAGEDGAAPVLLGRARFGASDLGVNRARIEGWLAALAAD